MEIILALILTVFTVLSSPDLLPRISPMLQSDSSSVTYQLPNLPTPTKSPIIYPTSPEQNSADTDPWGTAIKTGEYTYKIKVKNDEKMGTPDEVLSALNALRIRNGSQPLKTHPKLCEYSNQRAKYFTSIQNIDSHAGFKDFLLNQDGFNKLGFGQLGENSSYGYVMSGVHLIEFVYMQSPTHNKNQLDPKWDHACVGIDGVATNVIFATSPL